MAKRGRPAKKEFDLVPDEFKDAISSMSEEEINKRISEVAKGESENKLNMKNDAHLQELRREVAAAGAGYKEASKAAAQIIRFSMETLKSRTGA